MEINNIFNFIFFICPFSSFNSFGHSPFVLFPFYLTGLCLPEIYFTYLKNKIFILISIFLSIIIIYLFVNTHNDLFFIRLLMNLFGVCALIGGSFLLYHNRLERVVIIGGYSSMCVYLFHRIFLSLGMHFLGENRYDGHIGFYSALLLITVK